MPEIKIDARDEDIQETVLSWHGEHCEILFAKQTETGGRKAGTFLFNRTAIPDLIAALKEAHGHDSDCARHNEPATPNGPCDCSLSQ